MESLCDRHVAMFTDDAMTRNAIDELRIDDQRLLDTLMQMAQIGATPDHGCDRQAFTDADRAGRDLFRQWCIAADCVVRVDAMGNIFARRAGRSGASRPAVLSGSHLDTQPTGGRYDGVYGVLAALEVVRTLNDANLQTEIPFEIVAWSNEEGARFSPSLLGSGVWAGAIALDFAHARIDRAGRSVREELGRIGYIGSDFCPPADVQAFFELHIEQGPILERERTQIGVVTGIQGSRWYDIQIIGKPCHASSAMHQRRDPVQALGNSLNRLYALAQVKQPGARITFGLIQTEPGSRNTVPERVIVTVDMRHPEGEDFIYLDREIRRIVAEECEALHLQHEITDQALYSVASFEESCVAAVQAAATRLGYTNMRLISSAAHDSYYVSQVVPTAMIFVPCADGLSHNHAEYASPEDLAAGCNVLLHAVLGKLLER